MTNRTSDQRTLLDMLITRLEVWPSAELDEVQFHDAVDFMRGVGKRLKVMQAGLQLIAGTNGTECANPRAQAQKTLDEAST